ncbi:MAG: hypothetical protein NVS4B8_24660 [Herpetosiphon sp.]
MVLLKNESWLRVRVVPQLMAGLVRARFYVVLFVALRVVTGLLGVWLSAVKPMTPIERQIAAWPPSMPIGSWLERVVVSPWQRWDVDYYLRIAQRGYDVADGTTAFHPLFPWLSRVVATLTGSDALVGLMLTGALASLGAMLALERLAEVDLPSRDARWATTLMVLSPAAVVLMAPYTEGLFLLLAAVCLRAARKQRWIVAGMAGFGAALTRQQGVLLALPVVWEMASVDGWRGVFTRPRRWFAVALPFLGLTTFILYRGWMLNDATPDWHQPQSVIYSLLVSRGAHAVVPGQRLVLPPVGLWLAVKGLLAHPSLQQVLDLGLGLVMLGGFCRAWRWMRPSYRVYGLGIVSLAFAYHTGRVYPYMGLPRHLLLALPAFIAWGQPCERRLVKHVVGVSFALYLMLGILYFLRSWVP